MSADVVSLFATCDVAHVRIDPVDDQFRISARLAGGRMAWILCHETGLPLWTPDDQPPPFGFIPQEQAG